LNRKYKAVITDCTYNPTLEAPIEKDILSKVDAEVYKFQYGLSRDERGIKRVTRDADVVLVDIGRISRETICSMSKAKGIISYGIGYDNIDLEAAKERGIIVCNNPHYLSYEVADHTVTLILTLLRKIPWIAAKVKSGEWWTSWLPYRPILNLDGRKVGVVGFGNIGRQVAERLKAFRMEISAYDPYVDEGTIDKLGFKPVDLETLMRESDIVTIHTSLTDRTRHLINKRMIGLLKEKAILVNTSRGAVIDQHALCEALENRKIMGAVLDVLEKEPPNPNDEIFKLDNVIITPHMGWCSEESAIRGQHLAAEEAARVLCGEPPKHRVA